MAMLQMQRIFIYALKKDRKSILELLQRRGVLEISDIIPEDNIFHKMDVSNIRAGFEKNIHSASDALDIIERYEPSKKPILSGLDGRRDVTEAEYHAFQVKYEQTVHTANRILECAKEIAEQKAEIQRLDVQMEILTPWIHLDIPFNFSSTMYTKSFIGTLPKEWTLDAIYMELADYMPVNVDIISSSKDQTCIFVLCHKDNENGVYDKLRSLEFALPGIFSDKAPVQQREELERKLREAEEAIVKIEAEIIKLAKFRQDIMFLQDYDRMRSDKYEVLGQISQSQNVFVLTGYIPVKEIKSIEDSLNKKYQVAIETQKPSEEEDVPVLLVNNGFSQPLESVVEGFSLPTKGEIDPTMVMSLFYYFMFGIMLADAGYGTLMVVACSYFLIKYRSTIESSLKNFLTMFLYCGISTVFWGVMFGSYFGDLIDVIASTFFNISEPIVKPLWFFPVNKPMQMLAFSMVVGLIHLLTGILMKIYQLYKQRDYLSILYDAVSWFVLIVSLTILLISMDMIKNILGLTIDIPDSVASVTGVLAILASIMIVLTNGRESKNVFKRFLKGAYALYGITGYLSDVLSYSRLLALGLASGIIGNVINKMATMPAKSLLGPLFFIIIVLGGHTLNIAINALGAYVHTNRLQYVEFFGKFYGGGGRPFNPFRMKTKYYNVKENVKNG